MILGSGVRARTTRISSALFVEQTSFPAPSQSAPAGPEQDRSTPPLNPGGPEQPASPSNPDVAGPNDAATKLAEAIDDFLGDLEKKFKGISDEILTKREFAFPGRLPANHYLEQEKELLADMDTYGILAVDDMAERCDRLEQEMLLRDAGAMENIGKSHGGVTTESN
ncbi:hypothetical protein ABEF92_004162 [Exophiala dermatitidis]|uniref:Uncharacterized protein n=1 Tax=Exophiala dermatitidis (strain ATCC 34100 / CBS 525.76 / NIH/UT8656) TaxID=858893 RepID=H6BKM2_EXODN|nr:uncharacterized protein HMPREF1120_00865 [Exophiala dermatitidis NIH/UT8656]EHY52656.1 hypothetical protein HMPREF1120_00865 [Exophiala dermatitidis NIH/UT8656]